MKISKTTKAFFSMLIIILAAMFYTEVATAMPAPAEYHSTRPNDDGFMVVAVAAPLGAGALCLVAFIKLSCKENYPDKSAKSESLLKHKKFTGGDEDEITAFGGGAGAGLRQLV